MGFQWPRRTCYILLFVRRQKEGLSEILLKEIFEELQRTQYVPAGRRETIRARIKKIIEKGV